MDNQSSTTTKQKSALLLPIVCGGLALVFVLGAVLFLLVRPFGSSQPKDEELDMPHDYVYGQAEAANGMKLHYMITRPDNVRPVSIHANVAAGPFYGVNGGFFYQDALLSIAEADGLPVNAAPGVYGSGELNAKYARGTLVWDGAANRLSVQTVSRSAELRVTDRAHYWAQGGISMSLGRDDAWRGQAEAEQAPNIDDARLRTAAVYDAEGKLYLVVSTTKGTLAEFRAAIIERIGAGKLAGGVFLDGDGSSQLRSREVRLVGDGRPVVQMLRLLQ
ncbi:phosphodiester glycosidase family protein [Paenibacillus lycopersici]|uniref:Phosphodiester glycosidase family protein n=1 Tax=Paenibacillus lycopersici TaxID=2704462 RepID=A0A6C0G3A6_9BACL|nr:phosphodiester glycosidase family protein [Paenibacillus lycopersici]QHT62962.1 phosphodiester glycosidase family protein [Paenibacillus lycopersici]